MTPSSQLPESEVEPEAPVPRQLHPLTTVALGLTVVAGSLGEAFLTLRAWAACDVGINSGANMLTVVMLYLPLCLIGNAVLVLATVALVKRTPVRRLDVLGSAAALIVITAAALVLWITVSTPTGYPDPFCPGNVPPWAPSWLPS